jgi:uncharacterized protein (TIGR03067 family)
MPGRRFTKMNLALFVSIICGLLFGCTNHPSDTRPGTPKGGQAETSLPPNGASETQDIQGTWEITSSTHDGESNPTGVGNFFVFDQDAFTERKKSGGATTGMRFKLDPSKKPKKIDIFLDDGKTLIFNGIYSLEGDRLTLCTRLAGEARPREFESKSGDGRDLYALRRVNPKAGD